MKKEKKTRLMIGYKGIPSLLVETNEKTDFSKFDFIVINGGWKGTFDNGNIIQGSIPPDGNFSILSTNQKLLAGEYNRVFEKYDNQSLK